MLGGVCYVLHLLNGFLFFCYTFVNNYGKVSSISEIGH